LVSAEFKLKKIFVIRFSFSPAKSKATVVFLNVGLSVLFTISSISALAMLMAFLIAGL